jgi:hypothetical protein
VISGVIESQEDLNRYNAALELAVRPVRLTASPAIIDARLRGRYTATQASHLDWHAQRHQELSERLATVGLDEAIIDTDTMQPIEVASAVLSHFGYETPATTSAR